MLLKVIQIINKGLRHRKQLFQWSAPPTVGSTVPQYPGGLGECHHGPQHPYLHIFYVLPLAPVSIFTEHLLCCFLQTVAWIWTSFLSSDSGLDICLSVTYKTPMGKRHRFPFLQNISHSLTGEGDWAGSFMFFISHSAFYLFSFGFYRLD